MEIKSTNFRNFKEIYPEWENITVGLCGWWFGKNTELGLSEYLYGVFDPDEMSGYEDYRKLGDVIKDLDVDDANVLYMIEDKSLKYFHLDL